MRNMCYMRKKEIKHLTCNQPNTSYCKTQNIHNNDNEASNLAMLCNVTMKMDWVFILHFTFYPLVMEHTLKSTQPSVSNLLSFYLNLAFVKKTLPSRFQTGKQAYLDICNVQMAFFSRFVCWKTWSCWQGTTEPLNNQVYG